MLLQYLMQTRIGVNRLIIINTITQWLSFFNNV